MNIEKTVKSAVAIATLEFQEEIKVEAKRLTDEEDIVPIWAISRAIEKCTPKLIEKILISVLPDLIKQG